MGLDRTKLKAARKRLGLTMQQAAKRAGFESRQHWNALESGDTEPRADTLCKIAIALEIDAGELLTCSKRRKPS